MQLFLYFNSMMVQLKHCCNVSFTFDIEHFNSNMVQLKLQYRRRCTYLYCTFQFQYGTIKTFNVMLPSPIFIYFNSNMVQLKRNGASYDTLFDYNFNSNMVQLKRTSGLLYKDGKQISIPIWYN